MFLKKLTLHAKLGISSLLARLRTVLIGAHVTALLVETGQGKFLVPAGDFWVGRKLAYRGGFDKDSLGLYAEFISLESNVLIVGTHVGSLLVPLACRARRVFGIEANPNIFKLAEINVKLNALTNVSLHNFAASDSDGPLTFLASRHNTGGSKIKPVSDRFEFTYDNPVTITVPGVQLDSVLNESAYDLVIMDIEGAEYKALLGMRRILSKTKVLICELVPNHLRNVAGITLDEFMTAIPTRFDRFSLVQHPGIAVGRPEIETIYQRVEKHYYYGGADLVCQVS
jgi:FkbM family methyltransferase